MLLECSKRVTHHDDNDGGVVVDEQDPYRLKHATYTMKEQEQARLATFGQWWPHKSSSSSISAKKMAKAGFIYCPTDESEDACKCTQCDLTLDGWEVDDDPVVEHLKRSEHCPFFKAIGHPVTTTSTKNRKRGTDKVTDGSESVETHPPHKLTRHRSDLSIVTDNSSLTDISMVSAANSTTREEEFVSASDISVAKKRTTRRTAKSKKEDVSEMLEDTSIMSSISTVSEKKRAVRPRRRQVIEDSTMMSNDTTTNYPEPSNTQHEDLILDPKIMSMSLEEMANISTAAKPTQETKKPSKEKAKSKSRKAASVETNDEQNLPPVELNDNSVSTLQLAVKKKRGRAKKLEVESAPKEPSESILIDESTLTMLEPQISSNISVVSEEKPKKSKRTTTTTRKTTKKATDETAPPKVRATRSRNKEKKKDESPSISTVKMSPQEEEVFKDALESLSAENNESCEFYAASVTDKRISDNAVSDIQGETQEDELTSAIQVDTQHHNEQILSNVTKAPSTKESSPIPITTKEQTTTKSQEDVFCLEPQQMSCVEFEITNVEMEMTVEELLRKLHEKSVENLQAETKRLIDDFVRYHEDQVDRFKSCVKVLD